MDKNISQRTLNFNIAYTDDEIEGPLVFGFCKAGSGQELQKEICDLAS